MKNRKFRRVLSTVLTLGMIATLLPTSAFAATDVTTTPGSTTLPVEYFTSTLYNWDEAKANAATATADISTGVASTTPTIAQIQSGSYYLYNDLSDKVTVGSDDVYTEASVTVKTLLSSNATKRNTGYYYQAVDGTYPLYATRTGSSGKYTYTWFYSTDNGSTFSEIETQTNISSNTSPSITVYSKTSSVYYLVDADGDRIENETTYISTSSTVGTTLYYQSTGSQEGKGFYFTGASNKVSAPSFSSWSGSDQDHFIYSGLAATKLSESTNKPFNNDTVNAANLFADSDNDYTKVYSNVNVPFVYDATTGYYELNSDNYAVYFNGGTASSNTTLNIADKPAGYTQDITRTQDYNKLGTGFAPFNTLTTTTKTVACGLRSGGTTAYQISGDMVYGFGMVTEVPFQMTDDGKDANGNNITFEFSGDDDVWVYVDGILALDIGGTHDAIKGVIDFATGDVTLTYPSGSIIGDKNSADNTSHSVDKAYTVSNDTGLQQTNLYEALDTTLTGFAAAGQHTLTVYYMDRGRGSTNCLIKFNLPQKDSVSVTKSVPTTYTDEQTLIDDDTMAAINNMDFSFTLYEGENVVANKAYSLYQGGELVGTGSTDANGAFSLKNGQTATFKNISLDTETSYHVVETALSDRWTTSWIDVCSVDGADIKGQSGTTSDTVTVTGSETATDTIDFTCVNSYAYVSGLAVEANPETIVLDFGLPTTVDILANDVISNGELQSVEITSDSSITDDSPNGDAKIVDNKLVYTPSHELNKIYTVTYKVTAKDPVNGKTAWGEATLTIIPATSVYYEESYGTIKYSDKTAVWGSEGTPTGDQQESGIVGTTGDSTYGTDSSYLDDNQDSYGTVMHVNMGKADDLKKYSAKFEYDFTGKGTAIYGRIADNTGYIKVTIYTVNDDGTIDTDEVVSRKWIDTKVLANVGKEGTTLYNIPIYNNDSLDYGTYHVDVMVYHTGTVTSAGGAGSEFYFDGYRVYSPMGSDTTAAAAYATDGEANTAIMNISAENFDEIFTLTDIEDKITDIDSYTAIGPNNEFYLDGTGYTVSFNLYNWNTQAYKLYLGMKAPADSSAKVTVGGKEITLNNAMDSYFDISSYVAVSGSTATVTISGVSGLAALTNIKVTGTDEFVFGTDVKVAEAEANYLAIAPTAEEEAAAFVPAKVTLSKTYNSVLKKATITVKCSTDVASVTINEVAATQKTVSSGYKYTASFKKVAAGTTYEVICYNADGTASEPYYITVG